MTKLESVDYTSFLQIPGLLPTIEIIIVVMSAIEIEVNAWQVVFSINIFIPD